MVDNVVSEWVAELEKEISECTDLEKLSKLIKRRSFLMEPHNVEPIMESVIKSHKSLCDVKKMDEKAAYGNDPAVYYSLAICGEAGEMANKIVKSLRNGTDPEAIRSAVISELPDVFIYSGVLAHVLDLDIMKLVKEKSDIVVERALNGYYGGPLK